MKLLSTLFATLALAGSVFMAPKAMAENIEVIGASDVSIFFDEEYGAYDWVVEFSDNNGNQIHIDLPKASDNVFAGTYDTANEEFSGNGILCEYYGMNYSYLKEGSNETGFSSLTVIATGDPESGTWSVTGNGVLTDERGISFYCDNNAGAALPTFTFEATTLVNQSLNDDYWTISLRDGESNYLGLSFNGSKFDGEHTIADCNSSNNFVEINEGVYVFEDDLAFTVTGKWGGQWSISGSATIANSTDPTDQIEFTFSYSVIGQDFQITNCGYATYFNPWNAYLMPEGVEGYVAYMNGADFVFEKAYESGDVVPQGSPLVLKNTLEDGVAKTVYLVSTTTSNAKYEPNDLVGTSTATIKSWLPQGYVHYALRLGEEGKPESVGFYLFDDMSRIPAFKAYLPVAESQASARGYAFNGANDLHNIGAEEATTDAIFNINGQRAAEAKGLVVREGKMMFVK